MEAFETGIGWFFWNFKTENHVNPHWDYLLGWVSSKPTIFLNSAVDADGLIANSYCLIGARMDPQVFW
jgi:hypothetical protein